MAEFYLPTRVLLGCGALNEIGTVAADLGRRPLLVVGGGSARRSGLLDRTLALLDDEGLSPVVYEGAGHEPQLPRIAEAIALARSERCDLAIGMGGGSAIDTAKAAAGLANLPGTVNEYHGGRAIEGPTLPLIAVPTTAGSGAEVTKNAVLTDPERGIKESIRDDRWFPRVAIVDAETTASMPPELTAATGSDALCQAIEAFTSIAANPVTDALAMQAIALIGRSVERAYRRGSDLKARADMAHASLMAGMAMSNARLGGVHGMAHPLGARYHVPHGVLCGVLLPHTMTYNVAHAAAKYATVGRLLGDTRPYDDDLQAAHAAVEGVTQLLKRVGIPERMGLLGVTDEQFDLIVAESLPSGSLKHNPRPLGAEDVGRILRMAL